MYRSYSVNDMPQPVRIYGDDGKAAKHPENREGETEACQAADEDTSDEDNRVSDAPVKPDCAVCPARADFAARQQKKRGGLLAGLKSDDLILIAVIMILLMDGCDDKLLIAALGMVLFSDYFGF